MINPVCDALALVNLSKLGDFYGKHISFFSQILLQLNIIYFAHQKMMAVHLKCQLFGFTVSEKWIEAALNLC